MWHVFSWFRLSRWLMALGSGVSLAIVRKASTPSAYLVKNLTLVLL